MCGEKKNVEENECDVFTESKGKKSCGNGDGTNSTFLFFLEEEEEEEEDVGRITKEPTKRTDL